MDPESGINRTAAAAGVIGIVALLAVVALVFGLGPFSDDELSAPEFLAQGDEICTQAHDDFLDIQTSAPRTGDDAVDLTRALIEVAENERASIESLGAPASLQSALDDYLAQRDAGIDTLRDGLEAAQNDDATGYEAAQAKLASDQADREKAAQDVGFNRCSQPLVDEAELKRQAAPPD